MFAVQLPFPRRFFGVPCPISYFPPPRGTKYFKTNGKILLGKSKMALACPLQMGSRILGEFGAFLAPHLSCDMAVARALVKKPLAIFCPLTAPRSAVVTPLAVGLWAYRRRGPSPSPAEKGFFELQIPPAVRTPQTRVLCTLVHPPLRAAARPPSIDHASPL